MSLIAKLGARMARPKVINPKVAELLEQGETCSNNHWRRAAWQIKKTQIEQQARSQYHATTYY